MKLIQKEISLDSLISHLPSVWPAYKGDILYTFDKISLAERQNQYSSNYGMIPLNIGLTDSPSAITEVRDFGIVRERGDNDFILSFSRLSKWYHFFIEYYNMLTKYGHCNRVYTSAVDYYNYESNEKYSDQLIYGADIQTYIDLDELFKNRGGSVSVALYNKHDGSVVNNVSIEDAHDEYKEVNQDSTLIIDVEDKGFFKWICDNIIPTFIIPYDYRNYWKIDKLYYPDVIKWIAWFNLRKEYDRYFIKGENGHHDTWDCKDSTNCCECEEYFNRGGQDMLLLMQKWYDTVNISIKDNSDLIKTIINGQDTDYLKEIYFPSILFPLNISSSLEDTGKKSIFSTEYELGVDYRTCNYGDEINANSGTVVTYENRPMQLISGSGYAFDDVYMEKYSTICNECGYQGVFLEKCPKCGSQDLTLGFWDDYTKSYIQKHTSQFCIDSQNLYYAFDKNNKKIFGNSNDIEYWKEKLASVYDFHLLDAFIIDNVVCDVQESEYGLYDIDNQYIGGKLYIVYRDTNTYTPYVFLNGKQIYASFNEQNSQFYFPFFYEEKSASNEREYVFYPRYPFSTSVKKIKYIYVDGSVYVVNNDDKVIDVKGKTYSRIRGYADNDDGERIYQLADENFTITPNFMQYKGAKLNDDSSKLLCEYQDEIHVYKAFEVKGRTYSKLADLHTFQMLTDDVGNTIEGIYDTSKTSFFQPTQGSILDLIYQVGNTANITSFSQTVNNEEKITDDVNYFCGDIITEMRFFYKTYDEIPYQGFYVDVRLNDYNADIPYQIDITAVSDGTFDVSTINEFAPTSLMAIQKLQKMREKFEEENFKADMADESSVNLNSKYVNLQDVIYCEITYYVGATLARKKEQQYQIADRERYMYGVKYQETVAFDEVERQYYLRQASNKDILPVSATSPSVHSISYPIYIYSLRQEKTRITNTLYGNEYDVALADFVVETNGFIQNGASIVENYEKYADMSIHNNMEAFPTIAKEYNFKIASKENIDSDIYIDRGINASFEKHLKLGEVLSLEALENYGNGYFKMMENQ